MRCRGDLHLPLPRQSVPRMKMACRARPRPPLPAFAAHAMGGVVRCGVLFRCYILVCGLNAVVDHPTTQPPNQPVRLESSRPTPIRAQGSPDAGRGRGTNKRASCVNEIIQQRQRRMAKFARWSPPQSPLRGNCAICCLLLLPGDPVTRGR